MELDLYLHFINDREKFNVLLNEIQMKDSDEAVKLMNKIISNFAIEVYFYKQICTLAQKKEDPFNTILLLKNKKPLFIDLNEYRKIKGLLREVERALKYNLTSNIKDDYL